MTGKYSIIKVSFPCHVLVLNTQWTLYSYCLLIDKVFEKIAEDFMKSNKMVASGKFICLVVLLQLFNLANKGL